MRPVKTHVAQGRATLIEVGAINDDQIKLVSPEILEGVGCSQGNAGGNSKALDRDSNHVRQFEITGQNEGFRRHLLRLPRGIARLMLSLSIAAQPENRLP